MMAFEKTVLGAGSGVYLPNRLATVVVDVLGQWQTPDGSSSVFDQRDSANLVLGAF